MDLHVGHRASVFIHYPLLFRRVQPFSSDLSVFKLFYARLLDIQIIQSSIGETGGSVGGVRTICAQVRRLISIPLLVILFSPLQSVWRDIRDPRLVLTDPVNVADLL
jgi:hypothetical protein